jgi:hypothetical protein
LLAEAGKLRELLLGQAFRLRSSLALSADNDSAMLQTPSYRLVVAGRRLQQHSGLLCWLRYPSKDHRQARSMPKTGMPRCHHWHETHSRSLDHRRRARPPLIAIASAFRCPTSTTRRLPRVMPVQTRLPMSPPPAVPTFTPKQGQYLAYIYAYNRVLGRPPAEADLQRHFGSARPPSTKWCSLSSEPG